ncbi:MAG: GNAT family N-acetyltransferase, partial [Bacteroidetes bacterium HGW-Bacteroidetes-23]
KEIPIAKNRIEGVNRGIKNQLIIKEENDFSVFWNTILIPNLMNKHNAKPVHTLEEIQFLKSKFPSNIRQFNVYKENELIGGTTIFESKNVAHSQYISANSFKNEYGTLDYLHHYLITEIFRNKKYFDFGISNEEQGKKLNGGLSYWKESFGATTLTQDFYEVQTKNYSKLEEVII